ncbi:hypothetical protein TrST_g2843 [Triparma strigata]|uniref:Zinc-ribbon domain-containing protein n=1 Tax=Triparma strigata TaxID=1606541 RepID=A0A9W7B543_9STRA|nr:hypothetical protein TrST_g2843 [Triparma strigata]
MFCVECGIKLEQSFKFCPSCGHPTAPAVQLLAGRNQNLDQKPKATPIIPRLAPAQPTAPRVMHAGGETQDLYANGYQSKVSWDLSGQTPFTLECEIETSADAATIIAKPFHNGLWRNGGGQGQGKMLFLRGGRVSFDIGWVGCVNGRTNVSDNLRHKVALKFNKRRNKYEIYVDDKLDGDGLQSVPDHPETSVILGLSIGHQVNPQPNNGDMAPSFPNRLTSIQNIWYSADGTRPHDDDEEFVKIPLTVPVAVPMPMQAQVLVPPQAIKINNQSSGTVSPPIDGWQDFCLGGRAVQSSNYSGSWGSAENAIRGNLNSSSGFSGSGTYAHTSANDSSPTFQVTLKTVCTCFEIRVYGRPGYQRRLKRVRVELLDISNNVLSQLDYENNEREGAAAFKIVYANGVAGVQGVRLKKYGQLQGGDDRTFNLNAVQVWGV